MTINKGLGLRRSNSDICVLYQTRLLPDLCLILYNRLMPSYDFICNTCQKRFEVFLSYSEYGKKPVYCEHCNSTDVRRRMTKVRIAKTEESRLESMADDFTGFEGMEDDPAALGRMMKKMRKEMGEELPAEFDEVVDRLEAGQSPEEIEAALPDLSEEDDNSKD